MSEEIKDVDTLELEDQNTETDLEDQEPEQTDEVQDQDDSDKDTDSDKETDSESDISTEDLADLNDEEFVEFMASGKIPDSRKEKKDGTESTRTESSSATGKQDSDTSRSESTGRRKSSGENGPRNDNSKKDSDGKNDRTDPSDSTQLNYKSAYEQIFKPFKANGTEITPRTVEDVVSLMQMGANYTKKMQTMAPIRKVAESLNKAEIKEADLNFLIDLHRGDKEAIKQLLTKHKVDPMDLDLETTDYKPKNNLASDSDVEFSEALEDIKPSLPRIKEVIDKVWDAKSKEIILNNPKLMRGLHEEIQYGRFDKVQKRLEEEKTFGRYKDKTDVEAYIELLDIMGKEETAKAPIQSPKKASNTPKQSIPDKSKAAPTKSVPATASKTSITAKDIFDMSDEDFNKLSMKDLV